MLYIENYEPYLQENFNANGVALATNKPAVFNNTVVTNSFVTLNAGALVGHTVTAAINSSATATVAQVITGWITSTSAAPTTITLPTGTLLGAALGAQKGDQFDLVIDNTGGASTVTVAVAVNGILSDAANTTAASFGQLTVAAGVTGVGRFTIMFSSPTAYVFTRTA